jgi:hypothetical protein
MREDTGSGGARAIRRAKPRPSSTAQVTAVALVIERIHVSSATSAARHFSRSAACQCDYREHRLPRGHGHACVGRSLLSPSKRPFVQSGDGTMARALTGGQTYCELTARQASIKSHRSGHSPLGCLGQINGKPCSARVFRVTQQPTRLTPVEAVRPQHCAPIARTSSTRRT